MRKVAEIVLRYKDYKAKLPKGTFYAVLGILVVLLYLLLCSFSFSSGYFSCSSQGNIKPNININK